MTKKHEKELVRANIQSEIEELKERNKVLRSGGSQAATRKGLWIGLAVGNILTVIGAIVGFFCLGGPIGAAVGALPGFFIGSVLGPAIGGLIGRFFDSYRAKEIELNESKIINLQRILQIKELTEYKIINLELSLQIEGLTEKLKNQTALSSPSHSEDEFHQPLFSDTSEQDEDKDNNQTRSLEINL